MIKIISTKFKVIEKSIVHIPCNWIKKNMLYGKEIYNFCSTEFF